MSAIYQVRRLRSSGNKKRRKSLALVTIVSVCISYYLREALSYSGFSWAEGAKSREIKFVVVSRVLRLENVCRLESDALALGRSLPPGSYVPRVTVCRE